MRLRPKSETVLTFDLKSELAKLYDPEAKKGIAHTMLNFHINVAWQIG